MIHRCMVRHEIDDDPQTTVMGRMGESDEIAERTQPWIDGIEIRDVIAVVTVRRGIERKQPDAGRPERLDMIEPVSEAGKIADSVSVRIHEGFDIDAIDDGVLVPEIKHVKPA